MNWCQCHKIHLVIFGFWRHVYYWSLFHYSINKNVYWAVINVISYHITGKIAITLLFTGFITLMAFYCGVGFIILRLSKMILLHLWVRPQQHTHTHTHISLVTWSCYHLYIYLSSLSASLSRLQAGFMGCFCLVTFWPLVCLFAWCLSVWLSIPVCLLAFLSLSLPLQAGMQGGRFLYQRLCVSQCVSECVCSLYLPVTFYWTWRELPLLLLLLLKGVISTHFSKSYSCPPHFYSFMLIT